MFHASRAISNIILVTLIIREAFVLQNLGVGIKGDTVGYQTDVVFLVGLLIGLLECRLLTRVVKHDHVVIISH